MNAQFLTDESGRKTGVVLAIADYERMLEDLEDLAAIAERRDEPTVDHNELIAGLRSDGRPRH